MASLWDKQDAVNKLFLGQYPNIQSLLQKLPAEGGANYTATGDKLKEALTEKVFDVPLGINEKFATALNAALAPDSKGATVLQDKLAVLANTDPADLKKVMDQIITNPANLAAAVNAVAPSAAGQPLALNQPNVPGDKKSAKTATDSPPVNAAEKTAAPASAPPADADNAKPSLQNVEDKLSGIWDKLWGGIKKMCAGMGPEMQGMLTTAEGLFSKLSSWVSSIFKEDAPKPTIVNPSMMAAEAPQMAVGGQAPTTMQTKYMAAPDAAAPAKPAAVVAAAPAPKPAARPAAPAV